jgi:hypothetical protein
MNPATFLFISRNNPPLVDALGRGPPTSEKETSIFFLPFASPGFVSYSLVADN